MRKQTKYILIAIALSVMCVAGAVLSPVFTPIFICIFGFLIALKLQTIIDLLKDMQEKDTKHSNDETTKS